MKALQFILATEVTHKKGCFHQKIVHQGKLGEPQISTGWVGGNP